MSTPDQDSPADQSLLHGGSSADEPLVHDGPSRRLISPPSFTERSHLSVGSDIALELALEEHLADRFPVRRTSAAARAFAARRRERQMIDTGSNSSDIRPRRHTLTEVSHLHDVHCDINMFEEREDHDQDQDRSIGAATQRSVQSMPLPQTMSLLSASFHALASDSQSDTGTVDVDIVRTDHIQDYQWHSDDDIVAARQNHRRMSDLVDICDDDDDDNSSLSSHHFVSVDDDADPPKEHLDDIRRHLIQAQARESTAKLSTALTGLWSAINTSQREAGHHLQATRARLEEQAWKANEKVRETERCMKEMAKKYKALEKQNKKLSIKIDRLRAENESLAMDKSNTEAEFREQMNNLVEMSLQTERDYKNMVTERDVRISQLEEEAIHLSEVLMEVEGRAEAEMRRRTWSEVSHDRDSVDLSSLPSPGGVNTSEREEALSRLEAPFAKTTQREAATEVEESAARDTETSGERIASPSTRSTEIFRGRLFRGANDQKKTKKDYGLESFAVSKADSMRYLASPSSTRDEERMTGEDEGLHYD